ncbi:MAG TPA: hypothetical protein VJP85_00395 [Candidatus Baltobacteraceae bacterium]|nr:hypothetical protein [Candidatus Baltobacteraceae bacterium]
MTPSATAAPAVRAAFTQLIDYAGLFPPAALDMTAAIAEYGNARRGPFAWMLGRFIVPASRIPELLDAPADGYPVEVSVIVDAGSDPRTWLSRLQASLTEIARVRSSQARLRIEALEAALPPLATQRETYDAAIGQFAAARLQAGLETLPAFVELPRDARWGEELSAAMFALSRHHLGAKLRCGGVTQQAFPSTQEVASFVIAAVGEHRVPMKATAGLHHPLRRRDEELGFTMHGFLNLLAAAAFARAGADAADVQRVVESEVAEELAPGSSGLSVEDLQATRRQGFISYGSCSFSEPTEDLQAIGIL